VSKEKPKVAQLIEDWSDDLLGRKNDSAFLKAFLKGRIAERKKRGLNGSYVLNLDARWGDGKTYFLKRFETDLRVDHTVAYVNAWEDDHADDPLLAIMSAIETAFAQTKSRRLQEKVTSLKRVAGEVAVTAGKFAIKAAIKRVVGAEGFEALSETISNRTAADMESVVESSLDELVGKYAEAALDKFKDDKATIGLFREELASLVADGSAQGPLFLLIDELDRCRPTYAIALLERLKHILSVDGVVSVVATDTSQLRHAISSVYGANFDGAGYLLRFFDRTYRFAAPDRKAFVALQFKSHGLDSEQMSSPPDNDHVAFFTAYADALGLQLREIERSFDILSSCVTCWEHAGKIKLELAYLLPLIFAECRNEIDFLRELGVLITGKLTSRCSGAAASIAFLEFDRPGRGSSTKMVSVAGISAEFMGLLTMPLSKISEMGDGGGLRGWVQDRLMSEFRTRFPGGYSAYHPPRSVCLHYPELVRSVGRLSE
jgi:hypothetical protein